MVREGHIDLKGKVKLRDVHCMDVKDSLDRARKQFIHRVIDTEGFNNPMLKGEFFM